MTTIPISDARKVFVDLSIALAGQDRAAVRFAASKAAKVAYWMDKRASSRSAGSLDLVYAAEMLFAAKAERRAASLPCDDVAVALVAVETCLETLLADLHRVSDDLVTSGEAVPA